MAYLDKRYQLVSFFNKLKLKFSSSQWPNYFFQYSPLENAIKILTDGSLISRNQLDASVEDYKDCASDDVIGITNSFVKDYVRFYFRPRSPTQFHTEGIKTVNELKFKDAHCPLPYFFLFDSIETSLLPGVLFSNMNCSRSEVEFGNDVTFLESLNFDEIYFKGGYNSSLHPMRQYYKSTEVLVPSPLGLPSNIRIIARSQAEKETLMYSLNFDSRITWGPRISTDQDIDCYFYYWTFIREVYIIGGTLYLRMHYGYSRDVRHHFNVTIGDKTGTMLSEINQDIKLNEKNPTYMVNSPAISKLKAGDIAVIQIKIDDNIAYNSTVRKLR